SPCLGWLFPRGTVLTLPGDTVEEFAEAQRQLVRIGIDRPTGAAHGGVDRWGHDLDRRNYGVIEFADVPDRLGDERAHVLDVRRDDEWAEGHVVGATHIPMTHLR